MDIRLKKIKVIYIYINDKTLKYAQNISWKYCFNVRKKGLKLKYMKMENRFFLKCHTTLQHYLNTYYMQMCYKVPS